MIVSDRIPVSTLPPSPEAPYTIGPPLPAETPTAPWRPKTAGRIAFFFGPIAGAFVSSISLRRMGYAEKAKKVRLITLGGSVALMAVFFFVPDALSRLVALAAEGAFYLIFPSIQDKEFAAWEAANPERTSSNGWLAIGWGVVGIILYFLIGIFVFFVLGMLLPGRA
jgi:hypothetical protein